MNIGVIGGDGKLGKRLVELGYKTVDCDLLSEDSIKKAVSGFDVLINCAGKYDYRWCQDNTVDANDINVFGVERVLDNFSGRFIHISCDCFYNGHLGFYSEVDTRSYLPFVNSLASTKYFQEIAISNKRKNNFLIIRTSELYDVDTENVKILLKRMEDKRPIAGSQSIFFTPTYIPHLVLAIRNLVEKNINGLINVAGTTYCTEEYFNKEFCRIFEYENFTPAGISHRDMSIRKPKRLGLDTQKAENINVPLFTLEEGLLELRNIIV